MAFDKDAFLTALDSMSDSTSVVLPMDGMPESFNVLVKEIRSLGLDIELERS